MGDEIKRAVVKDETLHLVRGADVWSVKAEQGKEPNEWKMVHFANVCTSEEFIETLSGEMLELVNGRAPPNAIFRCVGIKKLPDARTTRI